MADQSRPRILLGIAAFAIALSICSCAIVGTATGTGKAKQSRCVGFNFQPMEICCKSSPGDLIPFEALTGCKAYKTKANYRVIDKYILNKAADPAGVQKYNLQTRRGRMQMESGPICFAECAFKNLSLINEDNEVDFAATEKHFVGAVEGVVGWTETIANALNACETSSSSVENKTISTVNYKKCFVQPAIFMQCIQSHIIQGCPAEDRVKTAWCTNRLSEFRTCNYFGKA